MNISLEASENHLTSSASATSPPDVLTEPEKVTHAVKELPASFASVTRSKPNTLTSYDPTKVFVKTKCNDPSTVAMAIEHAVKKGSIAAIRKPGYQNSTFEVKFLKIEYAKMAISLPFLIDGETVYAQEAPKPLARISLFKLDPNTREEEVFTP